MGNEMKKNLCIQTGIALVIYLSESLLVEVHAGRPRINRIDGGNVGYVMWEQYECTAKWNEHCEHTWKLDPPFMARDPKINKSYYYKYCVHRVDVQSMNNALYQVTVNNDSTITVKTRVESGTITNQWRGWLKMKIIVGYVSPSWLRRNNGACLPTDYAWTQRAKGANVGFTMPAHCWAPSSVIENNECMYWEKFGKGEMGHSINSEEYIKERNKRQEKFLN
jgi:hypothetical protein